MIRFQHVVLSTMVAWGVLVHQARTEAAILASDSFETYATGATLHNNNGGTGFTSAYAVPSTLQSSVQVVPRNLLYSNGSVFVNGGANAVAVTGTANNDALIARSLSPITGTPVYFSFLLNLSSTAEAFLQFGLGNSLTGEPNASIGLQGNAGSGNGSQAFFARIPNAGDNDYQGTGIAANTTYFVVGKITASGTNYNQVDLFFNPSSNIEGSPTLTASATGTISSFDSFVLRTARTDSNAVYTFDALTIGTTYSSVVPIPEPSMVALGVLVPLAYLGIRWRRYRTA